MQTNLLEKVAELNNIIQSNITDKYIRTDAESLVKDIERLIEDMRSEK